MIVAVGLMGMMQVPGDQIVRVVPVRHGLVAAGLAVHMDSLMARAGVGRRASRRVAGINPDQALVDVPLVCTVQVSIVQVVDVILMANRDVAAGLTVNMGVVGMRVMRHAASSLTDASVRTFNPSRTATRVASGHALHRTPGRRTCALPSSP